MSHALRKRWSVVIKMQLLTRPWDRIQFAESRFALGRGAREGVYPRRYSTDRATKPQGKTASARRVAALLACGFVARRVTERCGYAPLLAPRHKPKSPATNCILSHGLVSKLRQTGFITVGQLTALVPAAKPQQRSRALLRR